MRHTYWILILFQSLIIAQFIYFEQLIPSFIVVDYNEFPVVYELTLPESAFFTAAYLSGMSLHFFIVEEIFRRRDGTIIWDKAALRGSIQLGFSILFYFMYVVIFSNLETRHHIESQLSTLQFFRYRLILSALFVSPVILCLLFFKTHAWEKNIFTLITISGFFSLLISGLIYYFEGLQTTRSLNDIEEERRILTNLLPIDIAIGFILWREKKRNTRLDKLENSN